MAALPALVAAAICSCALLRPESANTHPLTPPMGATFGQTLADLQTRFAGAEVETSPLGAPALKLANVNDGAVRYQYVIYEFAAGAGMQMAWARFSASSAGLVLARLHRELGVPTSISGGPAADSLDAVWHRSGETARFNGPKRLLVMLGPKSRPLREDVAMREREDLASP